MVVDMGGRPIEDGPSRVVSLEVAAGSPLPLAAARNLGARSARHDVLVFLDVDCVPAPGLVDRYRDLVANEPLLWSGPVGYLPPDPEVPGWDEELLAGVARFHDGRPRPGDPASRGSDPSMFWSLSFALDRATWDRIGGFDEAYVGYGGEDTDFARRAGRAGVELGVDGSALAFHQHHPVSSPPIEHLDDIVANATRFHDRWGEWPMAGWLSRFAADGSVDWDRAAGTLTVRERGSGAGPV